MDLAGGHLCALHALIDRRGVNIWNLGTGHGHSVIEVVQAFEKASGQAVPYRLESRRAGDVATCWADVSLAEQELGWKSRRSLVDMMVDIWRWQQQNPEGYSPSLS